MVINSASATLNGVRLTEAAHAGTVVVLGANSGVNVTALSNVPVDTMSSPGRYIDLFNNTAVTLTLTAAAGTTFVGDCKYVPANAWVRIIQAQTAPTNTLLVLGASASSA